MKWWVVGGSVALWPEKRGGQIGSAEQEEPWSDGEAATSQGHHRFAISCF